MDALESERGDYDPAVGDQSRAGIGGLDVAFVDRCPFVGGTVPKDLAAGFVDRIEHPAMARAVGGCVTIPVQARTKSGIGVATDGSCHEDAISPDDRAGVSEAGYGRAPEYVLTRFAVPFVGKILSVSKATPPAFPGRTANCRPR